jgi:hypothetical protein
MIFLITLFRAGSKSKKESKGKWNKILPRRAINSAIGSLRIPPKVPEWKSWSLHFTCKTGKREETLLLWFFQW